MRKLRIAPFAALAMGVVGYLLRRRELETAFEENGLPKPWFGVTVALALLTAAVVVAGIILGFAVSRRFDVRQDFRKAFRTGKYVTFAAMLASGVAVILCAALTVRQQTVLGLSGMARWVFLAFFALGMAVMSYSAYTQRDSSFLKLGSVMPSVFYCYWMVALYRINAGNPVLLDYCYTALSCGAASISAYYVAGFTFGRKNLLGTVAASLAAIYLLAVAVADPAPWTLRLAMGATCVFLTMNTAHLHSSLEQPDPATDDAADQ